MKLTNEEIDEIIEGLHYAWGAGAKTLSRKLEAMKQEE